MYWYEMIDYKTCKIKLILILNCILANSVEFMWHYNSHQINISDLFKVFMYFKKLKDYSK